MRIVSWNVNGIRAAEKKGFLDWLKVDSPDIVCLQETKARPEQLSPELIQPLGKNDFHYSSYWASAKKAGYSGVAIYSKAEPLNVEFLGSEDFDNEGRVLAAHYDDFVVISAYFPNSQEAGARLPYKLAFCDAILSYCDNLVAKGKNIILSGDYNIAHTPIDLARPKENEGNAGYLPEERAWMDHFLDAGYIDTFRHFHPGEEKHYSWWSYRANSRERNVGWRLDYHCVNKGFISKIKQARIRPEVMGADHCPVEIEF
jgi:exodeoxyribonuclease-3